jgi:hypothetical protein
LEIPGRILHTIIPSEDCASTQVRLQITFKGFAEIFGADYSSEFHASLKE